MSKIGRKPIDISGITVDAKGQTVHYKGPKASGEYVVPELLSIEVDGDTLTLEPTANARENAKVRELNREWGMHRALLSNALSGSKKEFEKVVEVVGLGYKGAVSGDTITFDLGYSHKIKFPIPKGVSVSVDKSGQKLTVSSTSRELLGSVCSKICELRRPEPYKGKGVKLANETIIRKQAKGK